MLLEINAMSSSESKFLCVDSLANFANVARVNLPLVSSADFMRIKCMYQSASYSTTFSSRGLFHHFDKVCLVFTSASGLVYTQLFDIQLNKHSLELAILANCF